MTGTTRLTAALLYFVLALEPLAEASEPFTTAAVTTQAGPPAPDTVGPAASLAGILRIATAMGRWSWSRRSH